MELEELELGFNQVTSEGAVALAQALRSGRGPKRLGLAGNLLKDAKAAALRRNCGLERLALASNGIGAEGGRALAMALQSNWRLKELELDNNEITAEERPTSG